MIYLIQPLLYKTDLEIIIQDYLKQKYPDRHLTISHHTHFPLLNKINLYFIIYDSTLKDWDGIQQSKNIRSRDYSNHLILVSNELDYKLFFRTHLSFLGVIDSKNMNKNDIHQYIDDYITVLSDNF